MFKKNLILSLLKRLRNPNLKYLAARRRLMKIVFTLIIPLKEFKNFSRLTSWKSAIRKNYGFYFEDENEQAK